jgi:predicted Rossmann-fold nucleotide-binding protein
VIEQYLIPHPHDLISPDGMVVQLGAATPASLEVTVEIREIAPIFVGFQIDTALIQFNLKSALAQLGLHSQLLELALDPAALRAEAKLKLIALDALAAQLLPLIQAGTYLGKLFAADPRRLVIQPYYLLRMFGRTDREGRPLLALSGPDGGGDLAMERVDGRTVAYISTLEGTISYEPSIEGFLPTLSKALSGQLQMRELVALHQVWHPGAPRHVTESHPLLVKTRPLHIRTVFGRVAEELLPPGVHHTSANLLQPDTLGSGDIYELYGQSNEEVTQIPLEFYTLEPYREYVFFEDRDQLQHSLRTPETLLKAFESAPEPVEQGAATFVVKGSQLLGLEPQDWVTRPPRYHYFPGARQPLRQAQMVDTYIHEQADYPILKAIDNGEITSQGVLFTRFFPTPYMKRLILADEVLRCLKAIFFAIPSRRDGNYFGQEDRALLVDLDSFGIPVYWIEEETGQVLQYAQKTGKSVGMFVPVARVAEFMAATFFGVYGSSLLDDRAIEADLVQLFSGLLELRTHTYHPLLRRDTPLAIVTGGGPGLMEVANRVARQLSILSCAYVVDFVTRSGGAFVTEQQINAFIDAKMTYQLDRLVERQAEFDLDFPIFVKGGIGTDFELALEQVRRKVGSGPFTPIILYGDAAYWEQKITPNFQTNWRSGTITGAEWISNCFYNVGSPAEALEVYRRFFTGQLAVGPEGPTFPRGFGTVLEIDKNRL